MDIYDISVTGWPNQVLGTVGRYINDYGVNSYGFKIGFSSNPSVRAYQYSGEYDEMILIYQTSSYAHITGMEDALINHFWDYCDNYIGGGGGSIGAPPYYLYIVRRVRQQWIW